MSVLDALDYAPYMFYQKENKYILTDIQRYLLSKKRSLLQRIQKSVSNEEELAYSIDSLLYIAAFLYSPDERESALGDMNEKFTKWCGIFGSRKAKKLVIRDILASALPLLKGVMRSRTIKILSGRSL
jgi:uncharacterized protein YhbP (UPF0306 family)